MKYRFLSSLLLAGLASTAAACGDDDATPPMESRTFEVTVENVSTVYDFPASGAFDTPVGMSAPAPIGPGEAYEFEFSAAPGSALSFATMFVQSNDWFYAPDGAGIALWDGDMQVSGDVTDQLLLWDAGTEEDEEPGLGADQAPRQAGPGTGAADDDDTVREAVDDWGNVPDATDVLAVTITPTGPTSFRARIENVSDGTTLMTSDGGSVAVPLAPGVWVVHAGNDPLFTSGEADRGEGLEGIAEDGTASTLASGLDGRTGIVSPLSPGVAAVHMMPGILFSEGMADADDGLEALAEDGDPTGLLASLLANSEVSVAEAFDTPLGGAGAAPAMPGESYVFQLTASEGDRLSLATMYVQSNDLFFAPADDGLDLFPGGTALDGDVTSSFLLWDAGTEVNEAPGVGLSQAPRQAAPDTGADEAGVVQEVDDGYDYPTVSDVIRVTVTPVG
jgi:hypothetical protein